MENAADKKITECPGFGLKMKNQHNTLLSRYHAADECYQKYGELSSYAIEKRDIRFTHQHVVDTYAAQHSGNGMKNITTAFSLIGLYYAIEKEHSGRQVQRVHTLLSRQKYVWKTLQPPDKSSYSLTVFDVLKESPGEDRDKMLQKWMYDVWKCWEHQHPWVRETCRTVLK